MVASVILWMTLYNPYMGKTIVQERFSSVAACETFVRNFRISDGEKPVYKGHFCFEDY
jgi:hypothetical protein